MYTSQFGVTSVWLTHSINTQTNLGGLSVGVGGRFGACWSGFLLSRRLEPGPAPLVFLLHLLAKTFWQLIWCKNTKWKSQIWQVYSDEILMTADAGLPSLRLRQSQSRAEWRSPPYSTLLFIASSMCSLLNLNFSRAVYRSWRHKQNSVNATFSHGYRSQCQGDDFVFTSNFLVVSLPDMGPLSPFSSLKSLISLMIFFSRSAWMVTCFKRPKSLSTFLMFLSVKFTL